MLEVSHRMTDAMHGLMGPDSSDVETQQIITRFILLWWLSPDDMPEVAEHLLREKWETMQLEMAGPQK